MEPAAAWANIQNPPDIPRWSDRTPVDEDGPSGASRRALEAVLREAMNGKHDLDYVVAVSILHFPQGIVGFGQSAEARAYLACRIFSTYSDSLQDIRDITSWEPSPRTTSLVLETRNLEPLFCAELMQQLWPIVQQLSSAHNDEASALSAPLSSHDTVPPTLGDVVVVVYLLFVIQVMEHVADNAIFELFDSLYDSFRWSWRTYRDVHVTSHQQAQPEHTEATVRLPLIALLLWIIAGHAIHATVELEKSPNIISPPDYDWLFAMRLSEADALLRFHDRDDHGLIRKAWKTVRPEYVTAAVVSARTDPTRYTSSLKIVLGGILELLR